MHDHDALVEELLSQYAYQRSELIRRAGGKATLDVRRLKDLYRPHVVKMAAVVRDWNIRPDVIMAAVFDCAVKNKHPNGPFPNLLSSVKYLNQALSHYLQVPYETVSASHGVTAFLDRMDFEFGRVREELEKAGVTDLASATSYPVEVRYLLAVTKMDRRAMFFLAQEALSAMTRDHRVSMWLNHRGVRYEAVARLFNNMKEKQ